MKHIVLTQEDVDDEDYERVNQFKWYVAYRGNMTYAARTISSPNGKEIEYLHQFIMGCKDIDHIG